MLTALSNEQINNIQDSIATNYSSIQTAVTHSQKHNLYYTIIQQKKIINNNYHIYTDIKNFVHHYIRATYEQDFGYDIVSTEKITKLLDLVGYPQRESILKYTIHQLKVYGQDELIPEIEAALKSIQIAIATDDLTSNFNVKVIGRLFFLLSTYNYITLSISLLVVILLVYIVLLPSYSISTILFIYTPYKYTNYFLVNHLLSVVSLLTSSDDRVKVYANNFLGAIIFFISKALYFVFIASLIIKQFEKKIEA